MDLKRNIYYIYLYWKLSIHLFVFFYTVCARPENSYCIYDGQSKAMSAIIIIILPPTVATVMISSKFERCVGMVDGRPPAFDRLRDIIMFVRETNFRFLYIYIV